MVDRGHWARKLLVKLGVPVTHHNRVALVAWQSAEGTQAKFNPLATTKREPGSTNFNSTGVQNYTDLASGLTATSQTLHEGGHGYGAILSSLKANAPARATLEAVRDSSWGTGGLALQILSDVKQDYETFASKPIGQ